MYITLDMYNKLLDYVPTSIFSCSTASSGSSII